MKTLILSSPKWQGRLPREEGIFHSKKPAGNKYLKVEMRIECQLFRNIDKNAKHRKRSRWSLKDVDAVS